MTTQERPLITFTLFAYNQERFIRAAIEGAFSQTYEPLEIILSDDCSDDHTFEIMQEMAALYSGPHTIVLNRNKENLGTCSHINHVMEIVKGEFIVGAAGDDISRPERTEKTYAVWKESNGTAMSIYSDMTVIDEKGNLYGNWGPIPCNANHGVGELVLWVYGCSHAWDRKVFDVFGPMLAPLIHEDAVIPVRSSLLGEVRFIEEPLVAYRRHANNTFTGPEDLSNTMDFLTARKRAMVEMTSIYGNWLSDIKKIVMLYPQRSEQTRTLQIIVENKLASVNAELAFYDAGFCRRLSMIIMEIFKRKRKIKILRCFGMFFLPTLHLYYLKFKRRFFDQRTK